MVKYTNGPLMQSRADALYDYLSDLAKKNLPCPTNMQLAEAFEQWDLNIPTSCLGLLEGQGKIKRSQVGRIRVITIVETGKSTAANPTKEQLRIVSGKQQFDPVPCDDSGDVELAKMYLRRKYPNVYNAYSVHGDPGLKGMYVVGNQTVTKRKLLEMAGCVPAFQQSVRNLAA